jgi:dTDP-glucose 4,6-dehydratase
MASVLVTGGAGFIGSNLVRTILRETTWTVVNFDALTYAGNLESLTDVSDHPRYSFVLGDIADPAAVNAAIVEHGVTGIINAAAETHVDRSISDASPFVRTNVLGTQVLLEAARHHSITRFVQVSTDEVYGSLGPDGAFTEESPLQPNSPYAASKAGADCLVRAYTHTYGLHTVVTRCSNNYGPYQFPEKFIPLMILNALEGRALPIYGDGKQVRDWLHVEDHCRAIIAAYEHGRSGAVYNIGGASERENIDVATRILDALGCSHDLLMHVQDRPGHDRRYAIDASRAMHELQWTPRHDFENGLIDTIAWYRSNTAWCDHVRSGAYREYYEEHYHTRF